MSRGRLGKRALFSEPASVKAGPFDLTVECSSCNARTTLTPPRFAVQHVPIGAWLPWRRNSNLMRCPACKKLAWHSVSRAR